MEATEQFHARRLRERHQEIARRMAELRADAEHWNRTHPNEEPIVIDMDLGPEVADALAASIVCTGIAASWCPIHGNCTCREFEDCPEADDVLATWGGLNRPDCPVHGTESNHPDGYEVRTERTET